MYTIQTVEKHVCGISKIVIQMEGKQKNIPLWRRYIDGLYTKDDVQLLKDELNSDSSDYRLLDNLSAEVWEESAVQQPYTDLEREKYKKRHGCC